MLMLIFVLFFSGHIVRSKYAIMCGGLHSDRLAKLSDAPEEPVIIPFRGEYLELIEEKRHLVKGNIYPVCQAYSRNSIFL